MVTGLDDTTHLGIDGVYHNPDGYPPYIIAEAKYNTAKLSYLRKDGVRVGKQMDEGWIFKGKRLEDAVGEEQAKLLERAYKRGDVGTQLVNIKKDGDVLLRYLDKNANLIRK